RRGRRGSGAARVPLAERGRAGGGALEAGRGQAVAAGLPDRRPKGDCWGDKVGKGRKGIRATQVPLDQKVLPGRGALQALRGQEVPPALPDRRDRGGPPANRGLPERQMCCTQTG